MAKIFEVIYTIRGALDGSFMSAIAKATSGLNGLKNAARGTAEIGGGSLSKRLKELQDAQRLLERMKTAMNGGAREGYEE